MPDKTRQNFVDDVKAQIKQAYDAAGIGPTNINYWDQWVLDGLSAARNRWFTQYEASGLTQQLKNSILLYFSLKSVGYDDFSNNKKVYGDQLRAYVARAQAVYDMAVAMVSSLEIQIASDTNPLTRELHVLQLKREVSTANANAANLRTQEDTLDNALRSGQAV